MISAATDTTQIKFTTKDINENMFTKKQLWDSVVRFSKENEKLVKQLKKANDHICDTCLDDVIECDECEWY